MSPFEQIVHHYLTHLYGPRAGEVQRRLNQRLAHFQSLALFPSAQIENSAKHAPSWSEKDQWVISYGDSIIEDSVPPLAVLSDFLQKRLGDRISGVHVLPFFPGAATTVSRSSTTGKLTPTLVTGRISVNWPVITT
ncbi:hypothetical protein HORIV_21600 [Vreelandella olivaria]|uniref:Uncharacterized protein n=1 Tax=Vreelandella olivaria TaxID=390919 RepID=A0ABN5WS18_9GAMM|nr:hypothetical protein HORIV_21600 [Halomonas olivaria]